MEGTTYDKLLEDSMTGYYTGIIILIIIGIIYYIIN